MQVRLTLQKRILEQEYILVIKLVSIARRANADSPMQEIFSGELSLDEGLLGDLKGSLGPGK